MEQIFLAAFILFIYITVAFLVATLKKDNSIMDVFYGFGFIVLNIFLYLSQNISPSVRSKFVLVAVILWGLRLSVRILSRNIKKGEDFRYKEFRMVWIKKGSAYFYTRSFFQIFFLQGLIVLLVSAPIVLAHTMQTDTLKWYHIFGMTIWVVGFLFESVADYQLDKFIKDKNKKSKILKSGVWKYSRHPNYFGESLMWWGLAAVVLFAVENSLFAFISPVLITYLLLSVSGVPMLEKKWEGNSEWEHYKKHTSAFIPWFPKK